MHNLLPNSQKYANFLISSADKEEGILIEPKAWSASIVNNMGNYIFEFEKKKKVTNSSAFLFLCENLYLSTPLGLPNHKINNETIGRIRFQIETEADDTKFNNAMRTSNVLIQKDWQKWNWQSIKEIIECFLCNSHRFNEAVKNKFLKKLLNFYQPSKKIFIFLDWKSDNFIYAKCGYLLLKLFIKSREGRKILSTTSEGNKICFFFN